jgi:hypothetical protein
MYKRDLKNEYISIDPLYSIMDDIDKALAKNRMNQPL